MINRDLVALIGKDDPHLTLSIIEREQGERWVPGGESEHYRLEPVPSCRCCGEPAWPNLRCTKHQDRNPCLVEGCRRTGKAGPGELADDQLICGPHWRTYVPPGSRTRRVYNAHFRRAKRMGWTPETIAAFRRFWDLLARRVRRLSTEGALDEAMIRKMFGWEDDGPG